MIHPVLQCTQVLRIFSMKCEIAKETKLGEDVVRLTLSKVITLTITMVTTMLLSRFRSVEEYGTYSQLLLVINLFSSIFMLGLPNSVNYFLARSETAEEKKKFLSVYYSISTVLSIVMGLVLVLSVPLIESYFHNPLIKGFAYFLAVFPWTSVVSSSLENILIVYQKTRFLMIYRIVHSTILLATVAVVQIIGLGFREYMVCFLLVSVLFAISVYFIASNLSGGIKFLLDRDLIKSIFIFSIPLGLASIVGTLDIEVDKLLIGGLMDTKQLAIYTNASKELPLTIIASSVTAVLLPKLVRLIKNGKIEEGIEIWNVATELSMIFIAVVVFGVFVYAREVIEILYSDKYIEGIGVFRIYSLVLLLRVTYFGMVLNAIGRTKEIFRCSVIALVLNAVLNPLFYYIIGMIGPAIATFVSIFVVQLVQLKMTAQNTGMPYKSVYPWHRCTVVLVINIVMAIIFYFVKLLVPLETFVGEVWESVVLGLIWVICYLIIMRKRIIYLWNCLNNC